MHPTSYFNVILVIFKVEIVAIGTRTCKFAPINFVLTFPHRYDVTYLHKYACLIITYSKYVSFDKCLFETLYIHTDNK